MVSNSEDIGSVDQLLTKPTDATITTPLFCTVIAPSGAGKSCFIRDFLLHMSTICKRKDGTAEREPDSITIVSLIKDPIHNEILRYFPNTKRRAYYNAKDSFPEELYADEFYQQLDKNENNILILDDLMGLMQRDKRFVTHLIALATVYRRHCGVSCAPGHYEYCCMFVFQLSCFLSLQSMVTGSGNAQISRVLKTNSTCIVVFIKGIGNDGNLIQLQKDLYCGKK